MKVGCRGQARTGRSRLARIPRDRMHGDLTLQGRESTRRPRQTHGRAHCLRDGGSALHGVVRFGWAGLGSLRLGEWRHFRISRRHGPPPAPRSETTSAGSPGAARPRSRRAHPSSTQRGASPGHQVLPWKQRTYGNLQTNERPPAEGAWLAEGGALRSSLPSPLARRNNHYPA